MKILVTGATGFIGKALVDELILRNYIVVAAVLSKKSNLPENVKQIPINDVFELETPDSLRDVDVVIHCAARAHVLYEYAEEPLMAFRKTNTLGTLNLAKQSVAAGVKRFIFISSIGVLGSSNTKPFLETDPPNPKGAYAISKYEAELALLELANTSSLEVTIVRPPLTYGPNVSGNFYLLLRWMSKNIPLPFNSIRNKRSFIALDNLVDLIVISISHPAAANEIFLVSDGDDLSTTELLNQVSQALGKKTRLFSVNQYVLKFFLSLVGKKDLAQRLCSSLQVDSSKAKRLLNWRPIITVEEGLQKMAHSFIKDSAND